jgi:hypothetical protein
MEISVQVPPEPEREPELTWWPVDSVRERHIDLQRLYNYKTGLLDSGPGSLVNHLSMSAGESTTLRYLWQYRDDIEKTAAVLILASVYPRMSCYTVSHPDSRPYYKRTSELFDVLYSVFDVPRLEGPSWHHRVIDTLPTEYLYRDGFRDERRHPTSTVKELVYALGEKHARILAACRPIVVRFDSQGDREVVETLREEKRLWDVKYAEWKRVKAEEERNRILHEAEMIKAHVRWGEWEHVTTRELSRLVWEQPTTAIAKEFGVSDVAIGKKCRSLGISKPPRGYWAKLTAGKRGRSPVAGKIIIRNPAKLKIDTDGRPKSAE